MPIQSPSIVITLLILTLGLSRVACGQDLDAAKLKVQSQPCSAGKNVEEFLSHKSRHSQRDLGWRVFATEDGGLDVERAFMASKAMEIRYRWHVSSDGVVSPVNNRAESLCS